LYLKSHFHHKGRDGAQTVEQSKQYQKMVSVPHQLLLNSLRNIVLFAACVLRRLGARGGHNQQRNSDVMVDPRYSFAVENCANPAMAVGAHDQHIQPGLIDCVDDLLM
jgi:hypothetical protein